MKSPRSILAFVVSTLLTMGTAGAENGTEPRSLSLHEALAELDRQSPTLAQASARADEAAGVAQQVRAALLPTVVANGSYTRNSDQARVDIGALLSQIQGQFPQLNVSGPPPITIQALEAWAVNAAVRVPLIVPTAWYDYSAAKHGQEAADAARSEARLRIRTGFAQAAYAATAAEQIVVASERAVGIASEHARSAERAVQAGTAPPLVALRAKTEVVRRESDLARARAELERARLALGILLGRASSVKVDVPDIDEATSAPQVSDSVIEAAMTTRPDRVVSRAQTQAAAAQSKSAFARYFPQLSATGAAFASDVPYPTGQKTGWRISLDLTWTLYDGGYRGGRQRQTDAALRGAQLGAEAERLGAIQQIEDAKRDLGVARERLRLAGEQVKLASDAAASAKRTFEAGIASSLDVLDSNDRMYQADVAMADAFARFAQALWGLERALGHDNSSSLRSR